MTASIFVFFAFMLFMKSKADIYEDELVNKLLNNYTIYSRASDSFYTTTNVTISLTLNQILEVDEKNQIMTTYCWLLMVWNDPRLVWNETDFDGVNEVHIGSDKLWKPDIMLYNSAEKETYSNDLTNLIVTSNGEVQWWVDSIFKSSCEINIEYFPYDVQNCTLMFSSWNYDITKIDSIAGVADKSKFKHNSEFILKEFSVVKHITKYECCANPFAEINFHIVIERRPFFYVFNMMVPCVLITLVSFIGFLIPPSSGEKISVGITTLLSISVLLLVISADMPISDLIPLLGTFYGASMIIISLVTGATVFTLNIHYKGDEGKEIPRRVKKIFFSKFGKIIMFPEKIEFDEVDRNIENTIEFSNLKNNLIQQAENLEDISATEPTSITPLKNIEKNIRNKDVPITQSNGRSLYKQLSVSPGSFIVKSDEKQKEAIKKEWSLLSAIMDRFLFYTFTLSTLIVMFYIVMKAPNAKLMT